ncbi:hypothetical protein [Chondromyces apiculatus]|uniref:hypothetical protein n=1 Tax=Chondromyces apiculatus TaxID=51 RepID=UPI0012DF0D10|nr:hypothetical protein [Chondromyces apiculatus]
MIEEHLGALVGRLMNSGGWVGGERRAGAEPIWTGRARPYDESTLRKHARYLARSGGAALVARAVEAQVHQAAVACGGKVIAYTDMFGQVYWTKKPAYAAPIGSRGNRLLAATYFGLTVVRPRGGPALAYHVSWHKPASPLQDALEVLYADKPRAGWLRSQSRHHIWARGGSGVATLRWAAARAIPSLTVSRGSTHWTRYRRAPKVHTRSRLPVFVRRDRKVARGKPHHGKAMQSKVGEEGPEEVIFPAHPDKGRGSTKALRYRTGRPLTKAALRKLDRLYKTRWPSNENALKALVAVGFDRNLDRGLVTTTSRGIDGARTRLQAREQALSDEIEAFVPTTLPQTMQAIRRFARKKRGCDEQQARRLKAPQDKGARMPTGAEGLCKNLMLLMHNAIALLLLRSRLHQVRTMSLGRLHELLLGRSFLACLEERQTTLWIEPVPCASERLLQQELVRLLNEASLSLKGRSLLFKLREPHGETKAL